MNPLEIYLGLSNFNFNYDIDDTKQISFEVNQVIENILSENTIEYEIQNGQIILEKKKLPFSFFKNIDEFNEQVKLEDFIKPIVIQNYFEETSSYYSEKYTSDLIEATAADDYFFLNAKTYLDSLLFFNTKFSENDANFEFVDYFSKSSKTIVFASIAEKKRIKFSFSSTGIIEMDSKINYYSRFEEFKALMIETKQYPVFIKKSLINNLLHFDGNLYYYFFRNIDKIILEAKLDFNVYLHELSIDKIKADYKEYKLKYFVSQNEILNRLTTQIIALPLSVSGTVFAISRLEKNLTALLIVCFGLLCYVVYVSFLVKFYVRDINDLNKQAEYDYKYLSEQSFFSENIGELSYFMDIKRSINNRLIDLSNGLKAFTIIMWVSSGLIFLYLLNIVFVFVNVLQFIIIALLLSFILGYVYSNKLFKEKID